MVCVNAPRCKTGMPSRSLRFCACNTIINSRRLNEKILKRRSSENTQLQLGGCSRCFPSLERNYLFVRFLGIIAAGSESAARVALRVATAVSEPEKVMQSTEDSDRVRVFVAQMTFENGESFDEVLASLQGFTHLFLQASQVG